MRLQNFALIKPHTNTHLIDNGKVFTNNVSEYRKQNEKEGQRFDLKYYPVSYDTISFKGKKNGFELLGGIKPKVFTYKADDLMYVKSLTEDYFDCSNWYMYFNPDSCSFTDMVQPKTLKEKVPSETEKFLHITNSNEPRGTIAISTTLDGAISTDGLHQCAGLAVVDKQQNLQTLIHCFPGYTSQMNKDVISYILSQSEPKDLEISIIPGCMLSTIGTVKFLSDILGELVPECKINYYNFPNSINKLDRGIILKNGELSCCNKNKIRNKNVNPRDFIIYNTIVE